jgi:hypothetical protein
MVWQDREVVTASQSRIVCYALTAAANAALEGACGHGSVIRH